MMARFKANNPGCDCCDPPLPCRCGVTPWPYVSCLRSPYSCFGHLLNITGEDCQDILLNNMLVEITGVGPTGCCGAYNGAFCLKNKIKTATVVDPATCQIYMSEVVWDSDEVATCGPSVANPLPRVRMRYYNDLTTSHWTLYLNSTDAEGGIGSYRLLEPVATWSCGWPNNLPLYGDAGICSLPMSVQTKICHSNYWCKDSTIERQIYEWQVEIMGIGPGSGDAPCCTAINGTYVIQAGEVWCKYPWPNFADGWQGQFGDLDIVLTIYNSGFDPINGGEAVVQIFNSPAPPTPWDPLPNCFAQYIYRGVIVPDCSSSIVLPFSSHGFVEWPDCSPTGSYVKLTPL